MKKLYWIFIFAFLTSPAYAQLSVGDAALKFNTQASLGGKAFDYSLTESLKKGPVVVYFYPTAFGGGCSIQARAFATNYDRFTKAGATIVGVSLDDISTLNEFSADPEFCSSKFPVASDTNGRIANAFGLKINESTAGRKDIRGVTVNHGSISRTTFIVGKDGKVAATIDGLKPAENVDEALRAIEKLKAGA